MSAAGRRAVSEARLSDPRHPWRGPHRRLLANGHPWPARRRRRAQGLSARALAPNAASRAAAPSVIQKRTQHRRFPTLLVGIQILASLLLGIVGTAPGVMLIVPVPSGRHGFSREFRRIPARCPIPGVSLLRHSGGSAGILDRSPGSFTAIHGAQSSTGHD